MTQYTVYAAADRKRLGLRRVLADDGNSQVLFGQADRFQPAVTGGTGNSARTSSQTRTGALAKPLKVVADAEV